MEQLNFSISEVELNMGLGSGLFNQKTSKTESELNHNVWQKNIQHLKDADLESQLKYLVGRERQLLHLILKHIQEVDRRKLYAARAFSSLFEYLTKAMGYSFAAAQRRIEAARLMNQVPELALQIQKGDVNLSQIGVISQAVKFKESQTGKKLSVEIKREVIAQVAQKTTAQTQVLVAEKLDLPLQQAERKIMQKDQSCVLSLTLSLEQQVKLQRCRELLAAKMQQGKKYQTTVNYLEELMDFYLNKKDPSTQPTDSSKTLTLPSESHTLASLTSEKEKTEPFSVSKIEGEEHGSASEEENKKQKSDKSEISLKKQIFQKWDACQFHDPLTGRRCGEKFQLEMEHLQPRWAGGQDHIENRTLLCRTHNQWKYRQQTGLR